MRIRHLAAPVAVAVALALVAGGCGGDEVSEPPPVEPAATTTPEDTPPTTEDGGSTPDDARSASDATDSAPGDTDSAPGDTDSAREDDASPGGETPSPTAGDTAAEAPEDPPPPPTVAAAPDITESQKTPPHTARMPWGLFNLADRIAAKLDSGETLNLVLSVTATGAPDGEALRAGWLFGADAAAGEHGVGIDPRAIGPTEADVAAQLADIEALIDLGEVDCLAVQASEPDPFVDVVNKAVVAGIPTFTVADDSPRSQRIAFYGLDDLAAGTLAGRAVGEWATTKRILIRTAGVLTAAAEEEWAQDRMRGFVDGITEFLPDIEFVNGPGFDITSQGFDPEAAYSASEAWIFDHPEVDIIFHTDEGVEAVARAIGTNLLYGNVYTVGFHMTPLLGAYIREGVVVAAMVEGSANQAHRAARACGDFLLAGRFETGHVGIDPVAVTRDNVEALDWTLPENR